MATHVPLLPPRALTSRGHLGWRPRLVVRALGAVLLCAAAAGLVALFRTTWPGGMGFAAFWLVAQVALALWVLWQAWMSAEGRLFNLGLGDALLRYGTLTAGTVCDLKKREVVVSFRALDGATYTTVFRVPGWGPSRALWKRPITPVLYDPQHPHDAILPELVEATFDDPSPPSDARPAAPTVPFTAALPAPEDAWSAPLLWAQTEVPRGRLVRWLDRIHGLIVRDPSLGSLALRGTTLRLEGAEHLATVDLSEPFTAHLSARIVSGELVELSVELRRPSLSELEDLEALPAAERQAEPSGVAFRVLLPQTCVASDVPLQNSEAPWIDDDVFERLWPAVMAYAELHGAPLDSVGARPAPAEPADA